MTKLGDIIKNKRIELGLSQAAFGELVGTGQRTISDIEVGRTGEIRAPRLASTLGVSEDELESLVIEAREQIGKARRLPRKIMSKADRRAAEMIALRDSRATGVFDVQQLGYAVGGEDSEYLFNGEVVEYLERPSHLVGRPLLYAVEVSGDSMSPLVNAGEMLMADPGVTTPKRGDLVVVQLQPRAEDGHMPGFIKEFWGSTPGEILLHQYNPERIIRFPRSQIFSVHVVVFPS
jgi:phage repressor protein C with HTH and peptisase S24 domain